MVINRREAGSVYHNWSFVCEQDCKAFKAGQKLESRMLFWLVRNLINMVTNGKLGLNNSKTPGGTTPCNWRSMASFRSKSTFVLSEACLSH